jgi:hypothetical protein
VDGAAQADTTAPSVPEAVGQKAQDGLDWLLDRIERTFGRLTQ